MFVTPKARFQKGMEATVEYQKDEKRMKENRDNAKLQTIKSYDEGIKKKIEEETLRKTNSVNSRLKMKGLAKWSYEHVNLFLLFNDFFFKIAKSFEK